MKEFISKITNLKSVQHLFFWGLSLAFVTWNFSISNEIGTIDLVYAIFFHLSLVPVVYINTEALLPRFFQKSKYLIYTILLALTLCIGFLLHELVFDVIIPLLPIEYYIVSFVYPLQLISIFMIYSAIVTLLYLSKSWFYVEKLKAANKSMELHNLRLQINPHFLLNSLNSIYGLSLEQNKLTTSAILQLSELLKYMLYKQDDFVPIDEEIEQLKNYFELQKLRLNYPNNVRLTLPNGKLKGKILPGILLTFAENAFKHSDIQKSESSFIEVEVKMNRQFYCRISNSINKISHNDDDESGIGLKNVLRQLQLTYGENQHVEIKHDQNLFEVELNIKL